MPAEFSWEILKFSAPSTYIPVANAENPNGWNVSYSGATNRFTVSAPYGAAARQNYEVRYYLNPSGKSARFDIMPQGHPGGVFDIWPGGYNQMDPNHPASYAIYKGGLVIDNGGSAGWLSTWVGPHGELIPEPWHVAIQAPQNANFGTDYEWRGIGSMDENPPQPRSSYFHIVPKTFKYPVDVPADPPMGYLSEPLIPIPWAENLAAFDTPDSPEGGPASVFSVDLAHGGLDVSTGVDLIAANNKGPDVPFYLRYRTVLSAANLSSPGLPPGWVHNWDVRIVSYQAPPPGPVGGGAGGAGGGSNGPFSMIAACLAPPADWANLQLIFPSGASIMIQPVGGENPTGEFLLPVGTPFLVRGVPSSTSNEWTSISILHNGTAKEVFTKSSGDSAYRLTKQVYENGQETNFFYSSGKLQTASNSQGTLLTAAYNGSGFLATVTENIASKQRTYVYSSGQLSSISQIGTTVAEWVFTYQTINQRKYLNSARTKDPHFNNQTANVTYEPATGRVRLITDAKGNVRTYNYVSTSSSTGGANVAITGNGTPQDYTVDCDEKLRTTKVTTAAGDSTSYQYHATNPTLMTRITSPMQRATVFEYDAKWNVNKVIGSYGNYTTYAWQYPTEAPFGRIQTSQEFSRTGGAKPVTTYTYYGAGDPDGQLGFLKQVSFQQSFNTFYKYTALGNIKSIDETGSGTTTFGYDQNWAGTTLAERYGLPYYVRPGSVTSGNPDTYWYEYDTRGRVTKTIDPTDNEGTYSWNDYGQLTGSQTPMGTGMEPTIPVAGRAATFLKATRSGHSDAKLFENTYDAESGLSTSKNGAVSAGGSPKVDSFALDQGFGLRELTNGNGQAVHAFNPLPAQRKTIVQIGIGDRGLSLTHLHDQDGYLSSVRGLPVGTSQEYRLYDAYTRHSNDPSLVLSSYSRRGAISASATVSGAYTYDGYGRLETSEVTGSGSDATPTLLDLGTEHSYDYDDKDQLLSDVVTHNLYGEQHGITYGNLPNGSRDWMEVDVHDSSTSVYFDYDYSGPIGRLTSIKVYYKTSSGLSQNPIASADYAYDAHGRVVTVRTLKSTVFYEYNALGQITKLINCTKDNQTDPYAPAFTFSEPVSGIAHTKLSEFRSLNYNARGQLLGMVFDAAKELGSPQSSTVYASGSAAFQYDTGGRLTYETWETPGSADINRDHDYDNADNLIKLRNVAWTYDAGSDQVLSGAAGYTSPDPVIDIFGGITSANGLQYRYTAHGGISQAKGRCVDDAIATDIDVDQRPRYDAAGRRTYQTVAMMSQGGTLLQAHDEFFLHDGAMLVMRASSHWTLAQNFNNAITDLGFEGTQNLDNHVFYLWGPTGPVMEFDLLEHSKAILCDPVGNVVNTTQETGLAKDPLFYDGYGMPVWEESSTSKRTLRQPLQFKGQFGYYADVHTGLYYCHNRYYDPRMARWMTRDPIGLEGGVNVYGYCAGDPVNLVDPSGLDWQTGSYWGDVWEVLKGEGRALNPVNWVKGAWNAGSYLVAERGSGKAWKNVGTQFIDHISFWNHTDNLGKAGEGIMSLTLIVAPTIKAVPLTFSKVPLSKTRLAGTSYTSLRGILKGTGMNAHHIIEKRFAPTLRVNPNSMASIALTVEEHAVFTSRWRDALPYGNRTPYTKAQIQTAAKQVYKGYPELLKIALRQLK